MNAATRFGYSVYFALAACALLAAALVIDQASFASIYQRGIINSDTLYTYAWLRDLLNFSGGFVWLTPPNLFLFPDAIVYLICLQLTEDVGLQFFFYSIAYLLMLMLALGSVTFQLTRSWATALLYAGISLGALALFHELLPVYRQQMLVTNVHGGAFLAGVAFLSLSMHMLLSQRAGLPARCTLIGLLALTTASDLIFPAQFVVPVAFSAAVLAAAGVIGKRPLIRFLVDSALAMAIAFLLRQAIRALSFIEVSRTPWDLSYLNVVKSLRILFAEWVPFIAGELKWPGAVLLVAWLGVTTYLLLTRRRSRAHGIARDEGNAESDRKVVFLVVASNVVMLASVAAPVLTGVWHEAVSGRYVWPFPLLGFILLIPLALAALRGNRQHLNWMVGGVGCLLAVGLVIRAIPGIDASKLELRPDPAVARLLELQRTGQIASGLGEYWTARLLTVSTRNQVLVNPVAEDLGPALWLLNATRYFDPRGEGTPRYDFIVTNRLSRGRIVERYGAPARVEKHGDQEIFLYDRPIGEDLALRACRGLLERRLDCPLLDRGLELLTLMNVGDAGTRAEREIRSVGGTPGTVTFGPYLRLPVGRYEVTWRFSPLSTPARLRFVVYSQSGRNVVHVESDPQAAQRGVVRAVFEVNRRHRRDLWEFLVVADQPADFALRSVHLSKFD